MIDDSDRPRYPINDKHVVYLLEAGDTVDDVPTYETVFSGQRHRQPYVTCDTDGGWTLHHVWTEVAGPVELDVAANASPEEVLRVAAEVHSWLDREDYYQLVRTMSDDNDQLSDGLFPDWG